MTIEKTSNVLGIQIFSDFDGTITLADTGVIILDHCAGQERRRQMDLDVLNGKLSFRQVLHVNADQYHCVILQNISCQHVNLIE
jgi:2-hydroxy-3-keto-5-methylthiopentenyl-1-phosphate phosphatase